MLERHGALCCSVATQGLAHVKMAGKDIRGVQAESADSAVVQAESNISKLNNLLISMAP